MNVLAKIGYDNSTVEIEFPIDDDELDRTLKQNYMPTDTTKPFLVRDIDYPTILSELTGRTVNLDELNYLAKRLNCFDDDEMDQKICPSRHGTAQVRTRCVYTKRALVQRG